MTRAIVYHERFSSVHERKRAGLLEVDHSKLKGAGVLHSPFAHVHHYAITGFEGIRAKPHAPKLRGGKLEIALVGGAQNVARFFTTLQHLGMLKPASLAQIPASLEGLVHLYDSSNDNHLPDTFTQEYVTEKIVETVRRNHDTGIIHPENGLLYIRPIIYRDTHPKGNLGVFSTTHDIIFEVMVQEWGPYLPPTGLALAVYPHGVEDYNRRFKCGANYLLGSGAKDFANNWAQGDKRVAFHDALLTDNHPERNVQEATGANFFGFEDEHTLVTPSCEGYILPGITRATSIELARNMGFTVKEEQIPLKYLKGLRAAYLTGTATGHCPIRVVFDPQKNEVYCFDNNYGPFLKLQQEFNRLINGEEVLPCNRDLQGHVRSMVFPL